MAVKTREEVTKDKKADVPKKVNIFDKGLDAGVENKIDTAADAWEAVAPPRGGLGNIYRAVVFCPANSGFDQMWRDKEKKEGAFYRANLELVMQDGEYKGVKVYADVSTLTRRQGISTMASLMIKGGETVPSTIKDLELARKFADWLKKEPKIWFNGDWQGWSKENQRAVFTKMEDFPLKPGTEDEHEHITEIGLKDGTKEEIIARYKVKRFFSREEAKEMGWTANGMKNAVAATTAKVATDDDEEETIKPVSAKTAEAPAAEVKKKKKKDAAPPPPPPPVEDDDDDDDVVEGNDEEDDDDDDEDDN